MNTTLERLLEPTESMSLLSFAGNSQRFVRGRSNRFGPSLSEASGGGTTLRRVSTEDLAPVLPTGTSSRSTLPYVAPRCAPSPLLLAKRGLGPAGSLPPIGGAGAGTGSEKLRRRGMSDEQEDQTPGTKSAPHLRRSRKRKKTVAELVLQKKSGKEEESSSSSSSDEDDEEEPARGARHYSDLFKDALKGTFTKMTGAVKQKPKYDHNKTLSLAEREKANSRKSGKDLDKT